MRNINVMFLHISLKITMSISKTNRQSFSSPTNLHNQSIAFTQFNNLTIDLTARYLAPFGCMSISVSMAFSRALRRDVSSLDGAMVEKVMGA
jgi:hypothetical protein